MAMELYDRLALTVGFADERFDHVGRPSDTVRHPNRTGSVGNGHDFADYKNVPCLPRPAAAQRERDRLASVRRQEMNPQGIVLRLGETQGVLSHGSGSH